MPNERIKAAEAGQTRYHGSPCRKGHGTERYTLTGVCVVCNREHSGKWQRTMRERLRQAKANAQGKQDGSLSEN